jgi:Fe-S cluster biosynthesis and repair protein YggX
MPGLGLDRFEMLHDCHVTIRQIGGITMVASNEGSSAERMVHCVKFGRELPGLTEPPWPGPLGQRIYEQVSARAWRLWEDRMRMILNEYRLMPWQKEAQDMMARAMEEFFFGEGAALPPGYTPSGH